MHHPQIKYTIEIFARMYQRLPPLVPEMVRQEMQHALEHLENNYDLEIVEVENVIIGLGKKVWPYWKAYGEFFDLYQSKLGEKFLLGKLSADLKHKYKTFKECGGDYHDLRTGGPLSYFTSEERQILSEKIVEVDNDVRQHTKQAVLSSEAKKYENLVIEFQDILENMEKRLDTLRLMAEDEEEHPRLAEEIRSHVRAFEFGFCLLGPNVRPGELFEAEEYFVQRKVAKKLHRVE